MKQTKYVKAWRRVSFNGSRYFSVDELKNYPLTVYLNKTDYLKKNCKHRRDERRRKVTSQNQEEQQSIQKAC